ncbi:ABC-type Fe3+-hydroxamate transport system, periplasmic component [Clostridium pasteurianum DSM 525 = ATCC 6013]|uniref:ABC-type Fe3+-hydroxamate transport system, periplasmic component n=1 Tax=Clostridium pasteurianum DSM 525 = ATCC 6013 TaxID=1262449 RepID=A0A0H3J2W9_CLOPA|nr:ABC transporter substrate-binding protein [Clostridium pasteurianum]AJA48271.1 ABC-type Fe3+-hydroxamate transport system, periplasmic component [Clostridium pasteurianum DSM 525 = ATCC 6013]AJA52259.1 ABC-type Fe3+-hydroxamate transport system, periplasmic component [Clostridium pasteurianum DSM 525 = ATCC 6013]AOZ75525.1 transporter [Clostridium pasteurianum DSM 525 = ATCC 6013]AOZ79320.1 transporter [Clostridium pasteurianum]ELP60579.1 hypothetical protein F502_03802 [Clostridium pasteur
MKNLKSKIVIMSLLIIVMITTVISAGCGKEKSSSSNQNTVTPSTRTVVDGNGNNVTIPYKVDRIAAGGALNQVVLLVGGADKLVATAEGVQKGFFPKVYPRIKEIPAAYTGSGGGTLNVETILQTNPQVVFGGTTGLADQEKLKESKIAFLGLKLETPEDIKNTVSMVGKVLGKESEERAKKFNEYYDNNLKYVRDKTKSAAKVKVFEATGSPKGAITTIAANDINSSYIEAAGGVNIAAEKFPSAPANSANISVDFEFLYKNQPDVITVRSRDMYDYIMNPSTPNQWQSLEAVKNKKVYLEAKGVYLWSVRSAEGALQPLWLAKNLHPDLFESLDIKAKTKEYYKTFYDYDLSDSDLDGILNPKS